MFGIDDVFIHKSFTVERILRGKSEMVHQGFELNLKDRNLVPALKKWIIDDICKNEQEIMRYYQVSASDLPHIISQRLVALCVVL